MGEFQFHFGLREPMLHSDIPERLVTAVARFVVGVVGVARLQLVLGLLIIAAGCGPPS